MEKIEKTSPETLESPDKIITENTLPISDSDIISLYKMKWNEKCALVDSISNFVTQNEKFIFDFKNLSDFISICLSDSNIKVNSSIINLLLKLTPVLQAQSDYKIIIKSSLGNIVNKFKEKKDKLNEEINILLTLLLKNTLSLEDFLISIRHFPNDKSNIYKSSLSEFIFVTLRKTFLSKIIPKNNFLILNLIIEIFSPLVKNTVLDIKNCALSCLALIRKRVGKINFEKCEETAKLGMEILCGIEDVKKNVTYDKIYDDIEIEEEEENGSFINTMREYKSKHRVLSVENKPRLILKNLCTIKKKKIIPPISLVNNSFINTTNRDKDNSQLSARKKIWLDYSTDRSLCTSFNIKKSKFQSSSLNNSIDTEHIAKNYEEKILKKRIRNLSVEKRENQELIYIEKIIELLKDSSMKKKLTSKNVEEMKKGIKDIIQYINKNKLYIAQSKDTQDTLYFYIKYAIENSKDILITNQLYLCYNSLFSISIDFKFLNCLIEDSYEKIININYKKTISQLLMTLFETFPPTLITSKLFSLLKTKTNKTLKFEYCSFFEKLAEEYNTEVFDLSLLSQFIVDIINNYLSVIKVTNLVNFLYKKFGKKGWFDEIKNEQLKNNIEQQISSLNKTSRNSKNIPISTKIPYQSSHMKTLADEEDKIKINRERKKNDISKYLTSDLLTMINIGKINQKKEAIEVIKNAILESNNQILPNGLTELFNIIKLKFNDPNKNVVILIVKLLSLIIQALGVEFNKFTTIFALPLLSALNDKQQTVRNEVKICISILIQQCSFESLSSYIPILLKNENSDFRLELLQLYKQYKFKLKKIIVENFYKEAVTSLLSCLLDKSKNVRTFAEEEIKYSFKYISFQEYFSSTYNFKPVIATSLIDILQKIHRDQEIVIKDSIAIKKQVRSATLSNEKTSKTPIKLLFDKSNINNNRNNNNINNIKLAVKNSQNKKVQNSNLKPKNEQIIKKLPIFNMNKCTSVEKKKESRVIKHSSIPRKKKRRENNLLSNSMILNDSLKIDNDKSIKKITKSIFLQQYQVKIGEKYKREQNDINLNFKLETIEHNQALYLKKIRDILKIILTTEQILKMFNDDINKIIAGITLIQNALRDKNSRKKVIENLDLLLKQIGFKIFQLEEDFLYKSFIPFLIDIINVYIEEKLTFNYTESNVILNILSQNLENSEKEIKEQSQNLFFTLIDIIGKEQIFLIILSICSMKKGVIQYELCNIINMIYSSREILKTAIKKGVEYALTIFIKSSNEEIRNKIIPIINEMYNLLGKELFTLIQNEKDKEILIKKLKEKNEKNLLSFNRKEDEKKDLNQITQEELNIVLDSLNNPEKNIMESLLLINQTVFKNFEVNKKIIINNADLIFNAFILSFKTFFNSFPLQVKIVKSISNILYKITTKTEILEKISNKLLKQLVNIIFTYIFYENLCTLGEEREGIIIWNSFNSIMNRVLEFCSINDLIIILIEKEKKSRISNIKLAEQCSKFLMRIGEDIERKINQIKVKIIFTVVEETINEILTDNPEMKIKQQTDKLIVSCLRNLIIKITKAKKDEIKNEVQIDNKIINSWINEGLTSKLGILRLSKFQITSKINNSNTLMVNKIRNKRLRSFIMLDLNENSKSLYHSYQKERKKI